MGKPGQEWAMTASTNKSKARLWTMMAILAAGAGLIAGSMWIGWANRPLPVERASIAASAPIHDEAAKDQADAAANEARLSFPQDASEEEKIERLLAFVGQSGVVFIRNGSEYDGAAAAVHLREKLRASGLQRPTLDEFIEKIASRSSLTDRPYQVRLPNGETVDAGPWFRLQYGTKHSSLDETPPREGQ
jgi:hypothetical protein